MCMKAFSPVRGKAFMYFRQYPLFLFGSDVAGIFPLPVESKK
jgi:hypothetical protein